MPLRGKGFFIWKIRDCEGGNATAIANAAQTAGFSHVLIKIADGSYSYNYDRNTSTDLIPPVVQALRNRGMQVWGWHYVYGNNPAGEARIAVSQCQKYNLDGYVIDAEGEYKQPGKDVAARRFMSDLCVGIPSLPVALSSFRFPNYHREFPFKDFLNKCDINMPQVYWLGAHNAGEQLRKCLQQFQAISPFRPIIPTGPAFGYGSWVPSNSEIIEFMDTARALNMTAANYFTWEHTRRSMPAIWNLISNYSWDGGVTAPRDYTDQFLAALNMRDANQITNLYASNAIHITAARTIQGTDSIRAWYQSLFGQLLRNSSFEKTGASGTGPSRHFTWVAQSSTGTVRDGNDTIGIVNDKIAYHYTHFTVS